MSNNIPDKKFCEMLRSLPISDIAFGRFGSRAVESIWKKKNLKVTQVLCECLADVHAELGQSQFGRHVNAKLRVTEFVRNKDRWMQNQNNQNQGNDKVSKSFLYAAGSTDHNLMSEVEHFRRALHFLMKSLKPHTLDLCCTCNRFRYISNNFCCKNGT